MSVTISVDSVGMKLANVKKDLCITLQPRVTDASKKRKKWTPPPKFVSCFVETATATPNVGSEECISVPFAYGVKTFGGAARPARAWYDAPSRPLSFEGTLYPTQVDVVDEAVAALNATGSVLISCHTGFGKCLARGTPVLLYDGTVLSVEHIRVGDLLCGDDSRPRVVESLARGRERMARVRGEAGELFECNVSHILSLRLTDYHTIDKRRNGYYLTYLDAETFEEREMCFSEIRECRSHVRNRVASVVDVTVEQYLALPADVRGKLKLFHAGVTSFGSRFSSEDGTPHVAEIVACSSSRRHERFCALSLERGVRQGSLHFFFDNGDGSAGGLAEIAFLARSLGLFTADGGSVLDEHRARHGPHLRLVVCRNRPPESAFTVELLPGEGEYFGFALADDSPNRRFLLGDFTVTHNTVVFTKLAARISARVLFTTCRPMLCDQALASVARFLPGTRTQFLFSDAKKTPALDDGADVLAVNAQNLPKITERFPNLARCACVLVVDEAHMLVTETLVAALLSLRPRYVIALTATPFRYDELHGAIPLFFGTRVVARAMRCAHDVVVVDTGRCAPSVYNAAGELNWSQMLSDQADDAAWNALAAAVVASRPERRFLVLCKRTEQCRTIAALVTAAGDSACVFTGASRTFDRDARVLVATSQKCGVGFDHPHLDALLLACDVNQYFFQVLGRVFRSPDATPIVFDLVDQHPTFRRHFRSRKTVYDSVGGSLRYINASDFGGQNGENNAELSVNSAQ